MRAVKETVRKYYKYWTQPIMTQNVAVGGSTWGVESNISQYPSSDCGIYMGFDSNTTSTYFHSVEGGTVGYFTIYNPTPIQVSLISFTSQSGWGVRNSKGGTIYGSNDNSNWTTITTYTNSSTSDFSISINTIGEFYKYYKLYSNGVVNPSASGGNYWTFSNCAFTAVTQGTAEDYDFYKDVAVYKLPVDTTTNTYKAIKY